MCNKKLAFSYLFYVYTYLSITHGHFKEKIAEFHLDWLMFIGYFGYKMTAHVISSKNELLPLCKFKTENAFMNFMQLKCTFNMVNLNDFKTTPLSPFQDFTAKKTSSWFLFVMSNSWNSIPSHNILE